jgi:uncharacterized membrane protein
MTDNLPAPKLAEAIDKDENLKNLKPRAKQAIMSFVKTTVSHYSGPIPSASQLKEYMALNPGFGDKIFTMAEKNAAHRIATDNKLLAISARGQVFAFIIAILTVAAGFYCIYKDFFKCATVIFSTTIIFLGGAFFLNKLINK